jgi:D-alanyl-D-alanine carboxypeptidase (penicillin-binding protein 5/6)
MDWGFRAFERVNFFAKGEVLGWASVFGGEAGSVGLVSKDSIDVLLPRGSRDQIKGQIVYQGPVRAPVEAGQEIGLLKLTMNNEPLREAKVYADADVEVGDMKQRAVGALKELLIGWW